MSLTQYVSQPLRKLCYRDVASFLSQLRIWPQIQRRYARIAGSILARTDQPIFVRHLGNEAFLPC